ncbi:hypothetical protein [Nonomuraea fuscirosea]|uniref:hypothetical protein n=1 Tax=Nonomuraea fuscirosea TaxID=1291556 RepID=UPI00341E57E8
MQHAMGLGVGVLLRRRSLPGWGALLTTVPVLFDPMFVWQEHSVLSDLQVYFLLVAAPTVLMWRDRVSTRAAAAAGLLIALATLTRTAALPLLGLAVLFLLLRRAGRRRIVAIAAAGTLPLGAYAVWYHQHHGVFALSGADGVSLWARTMMFADCSVIKPPPELAGLCPNGTVVDAASEYVWAPGASLNRLPGSAFAHNAQARDFAERAVLAQPLDYLRDVVKDTSLASTWEPVAHPRRVGTPDGSFARGSWPVPMEGQSLVVKARTGYDPDIRGPASVEPFGTVLAAYRYP